MRALPYIIGGGAVLLVVAAASKAKASTPSSSGTTKPTGSTTTKPTTTTTPASLSVPAAIIEGVLTNADQTVAQGQAVWLTDNGYPKTGAALHQYLRGEISAEKLRGIAAAEKLTLATGLILSPPTGVMTIDSDGQYYLTNGTNDELYDYAIASNSIPLVGQAATRLAAAGDSRAMALTQHLADIST